VALHVHERVSTRAIVEAVRRPEPKQLGLFADPQLPLDEALRWYQHDVDWTDRLILGDSLLVMNSLLTQEQMRGKVQMIYVDPPYGVNYKSNFQPRIDQREFKDDDAGLTREPEQIRAYRDTWTLGVHSYLTYLRDRLRVCRELLAESGSMFVQIGDENLHLVRCVLDEVFGAANFVSVISFSTTSGFESRELPRGGDYLLWYGRDRRSGIKSRRLFEEVQRVPGDGGYRWIMLPDGTSRSLSAQEAGMEQPLPEGARVYTPDNLISQGAGASEQPFIYHGKTYRPGLNSHWKAQYPDGMNRLAFGARIPLVLP
jgi:adenine-specific DNA-methyltransferase